MLIVLTLLMVAEIISIPQAVQGFSNPGLLTVLVLFVVAEGISRTGALAWYMGKFLGTNPNVSTPSAQLRLMVPVAFLSAFINNTPVVAVMLPVVQGWAQRVRVPRQQLLLQLSFAAIFGGTCTLIGTSTNLVVVGLLADRYPDDPEIKIGLFDIGVYGVPMAMAGSTYVLLFGGYSSTLITPIVVSFKESFSPLSIFAYQLIFFSFCSRVRCLYEPVFVTRGQTLIQRWNIDRPDNGGHSLGSQGDSVEPCIWTHRPVFGSPRHRRGLPCLCVPCLHRQRTPSRIE